MASPERFSTISDEGFQALELRSHPRPLLPAGRRRPHPAGSTALAAGVFRIDHDQAFQSTINLRYQRPHNAEWIAFTVRYDSGQSSQRSAGRRFRDEALLNRESAGFDRARLRRTYATPGRSITSCSGPVTSKLLTLPQIGQENDDHNPDRVKPRDVLNLGIGSDNLFHTEKKRRWTASLSIDNLTNKVALFNFLSTFSSALHRAQKCGVENQFVF